MNMNMNNILQMMLKTNPQMGNYFNMAQSILNSGNANKSINNILNQKGISKENAINQFVSFGRSLGISDTELNNIINKL